MLHVSVFPAPTPTVLLCASYKRGKALENKSRERVCALAPAAGFLLKNTSLTLPGRIKYAHLYTQGVFFCINPLKSFILTRVACIMSNRMYAYSTAEADTRVQRVLCAPVIY
jgi:hypothetical protein